MTTLADIIKPPPPGVVEKMIQDNQLLVAPCAFCGEPFNTHLLYVYCSAQCGELAEMKKNGMLNIGATR